ncbi:YisL family protein [Virgibacillus xinjiangensis]|uniref:UPF0344 protein ACFOGI_10350 n=1 Tax=Virgibacillus xinjiangensis TaxID=393090 RepID=A0ABV7CWC1_9BACI
MIHTHITSWVLLIILLVAAVALYKGGNGKAGKIVHMILRLDYLLVLFTGIMLLWNYLSNPSMPILAEAITKGLAGLWVIAAAEMIMGKTKKEKPARGPWIQLVIAILLALILGFGRLPLGISP